MWTSSGSGKTKNNILHVNPAVMIIVPGMGENTEPWKNEYFLSRLLIVNNCNSWMILQLDDIMETGNRTYIPSIRASVYPTFSFRQTDSC